MIKIPAQYNTTNPPGQIVNPVPKQNYENLSFETWIEQGSKRKMISLNYGEDSEDILFLMKRAWNAAQENK